MCFFFGDEESGFDGVYGSVGQTFLWNALVATLRAKGDIVLTIA